MSSTITPTAATTIQDLTNSLLARYDTNKDGQFSLDEFSSFLNAFMKNISGSAVSGGSTTAPGTTTAVTTPALLSNGVSTSSSRLNDPLPACPAGWNAEKWANPDHTSVKYVAGRIMARYSPGDWVNEATREQILADFRAAGLKPTASGKDKCDFNDGAGAIDIVQSASTGGKAWQWLPVGQA
jgi:hypothetical protein